MRLNEYDAEDVDRLLGTTDGDYIPDNATIVVVGDRVVKRDGTSIPIDEYIEQSVPDPWESKRESAEDNLMQDTKTGHFHEIPEPEAIEAESQGIPVFRVGEILTIKGARVRVRSIGRKVLTLEGLPGTHFDIDDGMIPATREG